MDKWLKTNDAEWIGSAINAVPYGEVVLKIQDHRIVSIETVGRQRFKQFEIINEKTS